MINIGDVVRLNKTGIPTTGTVLGVMKAKFYFYIFTNRNPGQFPLWTKLYPDWELGNLVFVEYENPQKNCSIEEYRLSLKTELEIPEATLRDMYEKNVPEQSIVFVPEDDLTLIHEACNSWA